MATPMATPMDAPVDRPAPLGASAPAAAPLPSPFRLRSGNGLLVALDVTEREGDWRVAEGVGVTPAGLTLALAAEERVPVGVGVGDCETVLDTVGVKELVSETVGEGVGEPATELDAVGLRVLLGVPLSEVVEEAVCEGVAELVGVCVPAHGELEGPQAEHASVAPAPVSTAP